MAYTIPTPATLRTKFPAFTAVPDATIQAYIDQAAGMIDQTWLETDYTYGIELYAAHLMVLAGLGTGAQAQAAAEGLLGYSTVRSGQLTLQRAATSQSGGGVPSPYDQTAYGIQFYWLARRNRPPVAVASDGVPVADGMYAPLGSPARLYPWGY